MNAKEASSTRSVSVVVPVYKSAESLDELVERIAAVLERSGRAFEIIRMEMGDPKNSVRL